MCRQKPKSVIYRHIYGLKINGERPTLDRSGRSRVVHSILVARLLARALCAHLRLVPKSCMRLVEAP